MTTITVLLKATIPGINAIFFDKRKTTRDDSLFSPSAT